MKKMILEIKEKFAEYTHSVKGRATTGTILE
jgi:hypothetical protein